MPTKVVAIRYHRELDRPPKVPIGELIVQPAEDFVATFSRTHLRVRRLAGDPVTATTHLDTGITELFDEGSRRLQKSRPHKRSATGGHGGAWSLRRVGSSERILGCPCVLHMAVLEDLCIEAWLEEAVSHSRAARHFLSTLLPGCQSGDSRHGIPMRVRMRGRLAGAPIAVDIEAVQRTEDADEAEAPSPPNVFEQPVLLTGQGTGVRHAIAAMTSVRDIELRDFDFGVFISQRAFQAITPVANAVVRGMTRFTTETADGRLVLDLALFNTIAGLLSVVDGDGTDRTSDVVTFLMRALFVARFGDLPLEAQLTQHETLRRQALRYGLGSPEVPRYLPMETSAGAGNWVASEPIDLERFLDAEWVSAHRRIVPMRSFVDYFRERFYPGSAVPAADIDVFAGLLFGGLSRWRDLLLPQQLDPVLQQPIYDAIGSGRGLADEARLATMERGAATAPNEIELLDFTEWNYVSAHIVDWRFHDFQVRVELPGDKDAVRFLSASEVELNFSISMDFDFESTHRSTDLGILAAALSGGLTVAYGTSIGHGHGTVSSAVVVGTLTVNDAAISVDIDSSRTSANLLVELAGASILASGYVLLPSGALQPLFDTLLGNVLDAAVSRIMLSEDALESLRSGWNALGGPRGPLELSVGNFRGDSGLFALGTLGSPAPLDDVAFSFPSAAHLAFVVSDAYMKSWISSRALHETLQRPATIIEPYLSNALGSVKVTVPLPADCARAWRQAEERIEHAAAAHPGWSTHPDRPFLYTPPFSTKARLLPPWNTRPPLRRGAGEYRLEIAWHGLEIELPPPGPSGYAARLRVHYRFRCHGGFPIEVPSLGESGERVVNGQRASVMKWGYAETGFCTTQAIADLDFLLTGVLLLGFTGKLDLLPPLNLRCDASPIVTLAQSTLGPEVRDAPGLQAEARAQVIAAAKVQFADIFPFTGTAIAPLQSTADISSTVASFIGLPQVGLKGVTTVPDALFDLLALRGKSTFTRSGRRVTWEVDLVEGASKLLPS